MTQPTKTKTIDFLPEKYRQATDRRRTSYWRVFVAILFVGTFAATAVGMYSRQRSVRREYDAIIAQYAAAQAQEAMVVQREARVAELRVYAELVTLLRHPWPRSRLIGDLFATLPPGVVVERFRITSEKRPVTKIGEAAAPASTETAEKNASTDLADLRRAAEEHNVVIRLEGETADQSALHLYLQSLLRGKLFVDAEIESIEATREADSGRSRFTARAVVLPAWGMPGGPTVEPAATPHNEVAGGTAP
jgi:hypothetical protein